MIFFMRYQGKEFRVRVESSGNRFLVRFNDEPERLLDLSFYGNDCSFIDESNVLYANVVGEKDEYTVWMPKGNLNFKIESEYKRIVGMLRRQDLEFENNVYAKMPGKIVKLLVKVGDKVEKGTPVIVMEAMKMENEIRSTTSGVVKQVAIKEEEAVETGALLVEIESTPHA